MAGVLATLSYASWYRGTQRWRWQRVFDTPGFLTALFGSLCLFAGGMALSQAVAWTTSPAPAVPWWQVGAWALLAILMGAQMIFYVVAGRRRGWNTAMQGKSTDEPK